MQEFKGNHAVRCNRIDKTCENEWRMGNGRPRSDKTAANVQVDAASSAVRRLGMIIKVKDPRVEFHLDHTRLFLFPFISSKKSVNSCVLIKFGINTR